MLPSMSRPANPYDNATCESFLKTLKREEIHAATYRDFEDLQNRLEEFIERYYNRCRSTSVHNGAVEKASASPTSAISLACRFSFSSASRFAKITQSQ